MLLPSGGSTGLGTAASLGIDKRDRRLKFAADISLRKRTHVSAGEFLRVDARGGFRCD